MYKQHLVGREGFGQEEVIFKTKKKMQKVEFSKYFSIFLSISGVFFWHNILEYFLIIQLKEKSILINSVFKKYITKMASCKGTEKNCILSITAFPKLLLFSISLCYFLLPTTLM